MTLLLTSGGLTNQSIIHALQELVHKPFSKTSIAFIPTAANLEPGDKWWLINDLQTLQKLKFKEIDIVDISALPKKAWEHRLRSADILFFEGGNTFHLMYWIRKSGLEKLLPEFLKTKVYIGVSAGSIVTTPSLELSNAEKQALEEIDEVVYMVGLSLVDFLIEPHINSPHFPELTFDYVKKRAKNISYPIYALDDQSAVLVDGKNTRIISEGKWKIYNKEHLK